MASKKKMVIQSGIQIQDFPIVGASLNISLNSQKWFTSLHDIHMLSS